MSATDTSQMNAGVRKMIKDTLERDGVHENYRLGVESESEQDIFDDYWVKIDKIKLPNTKFKLLQQ